jgi:hypothetical protein
MLLAFTYQERVMANFCGKNCDEKITLAWDSIRPNRENSQRIVNRLRGIQRARYLLCDYFSDRPVQADPSESKRAPICPMLSEGVQPRSVFQSKDEPGGTEKARIGMAPLWVDLWKESSRVLVLVLVLILVLIFGFDFDLWVWVWV